MLDCTSPLGSNVPLSRVPQRSLMYKLPGHGGSVNQVDFHPQEPIIASCSNDKKIYLGEISG